MACPNQASSLQGALGASQDYLAVNDLGNGSGWQQSKQNWALLAVEGQWARTGSNDPWATQNLHDSAFFPWCDFWHPSRFVCVLRIRLAAPQRAGRVNYAAAPRSAPSAQ